MLYTLLSSHTDLAMRLAKPALALRKLSLSPPGPSAKKTWAKTLMQLCHLWRAESTERERVTGGRMAGALRRGGERRYSTCPLTMRFIVPFKD